MGGTIEVPVWLVVIVAVLATIGLLDRLLIPSVRWLLRRRVNTAIDELNTRLELRIQKLMLKSHFVEHVTNDRHKQFCACEREQLRVVLPKRSHLLRNPWLVS